MAQKVKREVPIFSRGVEPCLNQAESIQDFLQYHGLEVKDERLIQDLTFLKTSEYKEKLPNHYRSNGKDGKINTKHCTVDGCSKRIRSKGLCKGHGGGKRCGITGCPKSSQSGGFCIKHNGGKRCQEEGCKNASQSYGFCKRHGGGTRCGVAGCPRSSQGGGFCWTHGGGKRCNLDNCRRRAMRSGYCREHNNIEFHTI